MYKFVSFFHLQVFINFSKQQKELAKDLEETETDSHEVSNRDIIAQGNYDEPLILLTSTHAHSSRHTSAYDEEQLVA